MAGVVWLLHYAHALKLLTGPWLHITDNWLAIARLAHNFSRR